MPGTRKKKSAKWDRCVTDVKRRGTAVSAAAVCTAALKSRRRNPHQVALYAQARGTPVLKYIGGIKFAKAGRPAKFDTRAQALTVARQLKAQFRVLRRFKLWAA